MIKNYNPKHLKRLKRYTLFIEKILRYLSQSYKFRLPKEVVLMDMKKPRAKSVHYFGLAGMLGYVYQRKGYYISINVPVCRIFREEKDTIIHEVSHLAEWLRYRRWSHSKRFYEIFRRAEERVKGIRL